MCKSQPGRLQELTNNGYVKTPKYKLWLAELTILSKIIHYFAEDRLNCLQSL